MAHGGVFATSSDKLDFMFELQQELMPSHQTVEHRNGAVVVGSWLHGDIDDREVQLRLRYLAHCTIEELCEATHELKNKPHRTDFRETDVQKFNGEVADAMLYLVEFLIVAGITPDLLTELYTKTIAKCEGRLKDE